MSKKDMRAIRSHYIHYAAKEFPYLTVTGIKSLVRLWEARYHNIITPIAWEYTKNKRKTVKDK